MKGRGLGEPLRQFSRGVILGGPVEGVSKVLTNHFHPGESAKGVLQLGSGEQLLSHKKKLTGSSTGKQRSSEG